MRPNGKPRVLVCARQPATLAEVRRLLDDGGYEAGGHLLGTPDPAPADGHQLVVIEGGGDSGPELCRRLRRRLDDAFVPILFVTDDARPEARLASFEAGADTYLLRPFAPGELLAQVRALLRIKDTHDRLREKTAEVHRINKRLQQAYQQIDQELELAQRIQTSFLPQSLPEVPRVRFAVHYALCGRVGGDFYDVFRLDEHHVAFYIADAMGHGVPASLLTIFLKQGVRGKSIHGSEYRLVPPGEVLARLNKELMGQQLPELPFITMVYVLLNCSDGTLTFARAGHPHPLHLPTAGDPSLWACEGGGLLGIFVTQYREQKHVLRAGDKLLLYTDGLDTGAGDSGGGETTKLLKACAVQHRALPIHEYVPRVANELLAQVKQADDFTLLGVEMGGG